MTTECVAQTTPLSAERFLKTKPRQSDNSGAQHKPFRFKHKAQEAGWPTVCMNSTQDGPKSPIGATKSIRARTASASLLATGALALLAAADARIRGGAT